MLRSPPTQGENSHNSIEYPHEVQSMRKENTIKQSYTQKSPNTKILVHNDREGKDSTEKAYCRRAHVQV